MTERLFSKLSQFFSAFSAPSAVKILFLLTTAVLMGCGSLLEPPRLATATAQAAATPTASPEPLRLELPEGETAVSPQVTPLAPDAVQINETITVWIDENSARHETAVSNIVNDFQTQYNVSVELRLMDPDLLPELMNTAVVSPEFDLPDVVLHPIEYTLGWAARDVLDSEAAAQVLDGLGRETFDPNALAAVSVGERPFAVPVDAFPQIVVYRTDWFAERNLAPPDNFEALFAGAAALLDRENNLTSFVAPTESNLVTTHKIFEHFATANGCDVIDDKGEVLILADVCQEALDFYFLLINQHSPSGVQTDTSTLNAYLEGRTAIIMGPPSMLPIIAGVDPSLQPSCPECLEDGRFLANNSGILTNIQGNSGESAVYGNLTSFGITNVAQREAAVNFVTHWFAAGYDEWLAVAPARQVPLRWGTADAPTRYIDAWGATPLPNSEASLAELFGEETVVLLRDSVRVNDRWGIQQGQGELITQLYEELTFSIVLQEMLSGYFGTERTLIEAYFRTTDLIPNYQYLLEIEIPPTPEP